MKSLQSTKVYKKLKDEKGMALIMSYLVLSVFFVLSAGFAYSTISELSYANRFRDSTRAFWLAESGIQRYLQNTNLLDSESQSYYYGADSVTISKDDSISSQRTVTALSNVNGLTRSVEVVFPANPPQIFDNTMSSGTNISLIGLFAKLDVYGPTRITGTYTESGFGADGWFEDKQEGVSADETTFTYPDVDNNGTADEFNDFVEFYRRKINPDDPDYTGEYASSEVVYIQSDSTQFITPASSLDGKKIVFVEGSVPGTGDVDIIFDATWAADQNITIVSTGNIDYLQPLQVASNSQMNIISWDGYVEASILFSTHKGVTYSHNEANFYSIFEYSETTGNLIANQGINANEALAWKKFLYGTPLADGIVPPGFEGLVSVAPAGYSSAPITWKEY